MELHDAADGAVIHRRSGASRVNLAKICFNPQNRGGAGIWSYHVHEVARHIVTQGTSKQRYGHVEIVKLPLDKIQKAREANRLKCDQDPLMPPCSDAIEYVCLSKTHFSPAQTLLMSGWRTLLNAGKVPIVARKTDKEAPLILAEGMSVVIYEETLLQEPEAMQRLMTEDNLNAEAAMKEAEIQAIGRIANIVQRRRHWLPAMALKITLKLRRRKMLHALR